MALRIGLALSNHVLCEGVRRILQEDDPSVILEDAHGPDPATPPDILLIDGQGDLAALLKKYAGARFVLLDTGLSERDITCLFLCHHISGIISAPSNLATFRKALKAVRAGQIWIDQGHLQTLVQKGRGLAEGKGIAGLTTQDRKIVALIGQGLRNREIADKLCLSEATIKAHVTRIFKSLGVKNRAQLISLTSKYGYLDG